MDRHIAACSGITWRFPTQRSAASFRLVEQADGQQAASAGSARSMRSGDVFRTLL